MDEALSIAVMTKQDRQLLRIIAQESSRLRGFIRRRVTNDADAEDLLQEVFYEVVEALRLGEPVTQWGAWMFRVARNRIVDMARRRRRWKFADDPQPSSETTESSLIDLLPSPSAGPAEAYARSVLIDEIEDALDDLPAEQREVFVAHEVEGYSFKEIAARTGVNINTLLSRKQYAVAYLRRRLRRVYNEFSQQGEESK